MMRLILCIGDKPETGGYIEHDSTSKPPTITGSCVAFIGSKSFCNVCKNFGLIEKSGGPSRRRHGERELALDGDILRCQCANPPKMKATTQSTSCHNDGIERLGAVISAENVYPSDLPCVNTLFDEQVRIIVPTECQGYPYKIELPDGRVIKGCVSENGMLPRVNTGICGDVYYVDWGDEALTRH